MEVLTTEIIPIKMWVDDLEEEVLQQAKNLANLPFTFKHVVLMPDCHLGFGMPIGGVMATLGVVVPNAVGVDIGCGMCAVKTSLKEISIPTLKSIMSKIRQQIPVGFNKHKEMQDTTLMPISNGTVDTMPIVFRETLNARLSLGTLGGGNHFIEIQKDEDGFIWIMLHSGSRNLGKQVADHYNKLAIKINEKYFSCVPKKWQLAFLPLDSKEGQYYMREMRYCVDFAFSNRKLMMDRVKDIFTEVCDLIIEFKPMINIAHNYATMENHGKNVLVHRKGATLARKGTIGIIPGSQGTCSYIVEGKGNLLSFNSCSHGAGRKMGRKQAKKKLILSEEIKRLDDLGVIHSIRGIGNLDEATGAYKDIGVVMRNQADLVDIKIKLTPLAVIKG